MESSGDRAEARALATVHTSETVHSLSAHSVRSQRGLRTHSSAALRDLDWQSARVYFLAFLNPSREQPVPTLTARLASLCHRR